MVHVNLPDGISRGTVHADNVPFERKLLALTKKALADGINRFCRDEGYFYFGKLLFDEQVEIGLRHERHEPHYRQNLFEGDASG